MDGLIAANYRCNAHCVMCNTWCHRGVAFAIAAIQNSNYLFGDPANTA